MRRLSLTHALKSAIPALYRQRGGVLYRCGTPETTNPARLQRHHQRMLAVYFTPHSSEHRPCWHCTSFVAMVYEGSAAWCNLANAAAKPSAF